MNRKEYSCAPDHSDPWQNWYFSHKKGIMLGTANDSPMVLKLFILPLQFLKLHISTQGTRTNSRVSNCIDDWIDKLI